MKSKPPRTGAGTLTVARESFPVDFSVVLVNEVDGRRGGKGSVTSEPETMRAAFRAGRATLAMDDGVVLDIDVIAHSDGSPTAYFQVP